MSESDVRGFPPPTDPESPFTRWAREWLALGEYTSATVPDVDERIAKALELWREPIPTDTWRRSGDARLLDSARRYCRSNDREDAMRRGEHVVEYEILNADPEQSNTVVMGARLIDGVNAVPLAKDVGGGRAGNVEADMLLLVQASGRFHLELVEVKVSANNAWYAAIENLRQLRLLQASPETLRLFQVRRPDLDLPTDLAASGLVLAPAAFFSGRGKKGNAVGPALRLLDRMRTDVGAVVRFAIWEPQRLKPFPPTR